MKVQFILAACLAAAAFAAPIDNFIDPDCIEEDLVVEEPSQEIEADFALGVPDLRLDFGNNDVADEDCVDDDVTEEPPQPATEECEDPIETTAEPAKPTEAECEDPITTTEAAPQTESEAAECEEPSEAPPTEPSCEEGEGEENAPAIDIRIEPAGFVQDIKVYGDEQMIPDIEECEE
jgi:hypothetical protein